MRTSIMKNFLYAFGAQVVSLASTLAVTLIVPSFIGVEQFGYWQLFLTYVSYVGLTRLGLYDGLYLRLGGKKYEELDFQLLSHERQLFVFAQLLITATAIALVQILGGNLNADRKFILIACSLCILIINNNNYSAFILQAVNLTKKYSVSLVLQNLTWFVAVLLIVIFHIYDYKVIVILYVCGHLCAGVYLMYNTKEIVRHQKTEKTRVLHDIKINMCCGIKLMIAFFAGSLVIASARMTVDAAWGVEIFGYFSFSLTLANVFLSFISQLSVVIFPALRRVNLERQNEIYFLMRNVLRFILPVIMLGYFPITIFVRAVLPQYEISLLFVPFFLPLCMFDGKMQMMCSSFFKSMRKEDKLLQINIVTLVLSVGIAFVGSFLIKNVFAVAIGILFVVAFRSVAAELLLARYMDTKITKEVVQELLLVVAFIIGVQYLSLSMIFILSIAVYGIYLAVNAKQIKQIFVIAKEIAQK